MVKIVVAIGVERETIFTESLKKMFFFSSSSSAIGSGDKCFTNSCYKFFETRQTWTENQNTCRGEGGDLVSIETEAEWRYVNNEIQKIPEVNAWHIGLQLKQGDWKWVSGQPLEKHLEKWQPGQPSGDGNEAEMSKNYPSGSKGLFNDLPGSQAKPFICEIPNGKLILEENWKSKKHAPAVQFLILHGLRLNSDSIKWCFFKLKNAIYTHLLFWLVISCLVKNENQLTTLLSDGEFRTD